MRTSLLAAVLAGVLALVLGTLPLEAQLKDVRVVRGDLLKAELNGKRVQLKLAGIWAPTPPGLGKKSEYQGAEAREFVVSTLSTQSFTVHGLADPHPGKATPVQIQVGDEPGQDLAVLLVDAGLALRASSSELSAEQAKAIRSAEGRARRGSIGLHDGGMQQFAKAQKNQRDFGVEVYNPSQLRPGGTNATPNGGEIIGDLYLGIIWVPRTDDTPP